MPNERRLHYLVRGEVEAVRGVGEDSQVVSQRPARTTTCSGRTFSLPSPILLAQTPELSLGADLHQPEETGDLSSFQTLIPICETKTRFHLRRFCMEQCLNLGFFHLTHGVDGLEAPEAG